MFNSYSELNSHKGYQVSIKSGLFGNKVVYRDTKKGIKMPKNSKVKIKPAESGVKLYVKGKELSPDIFYEIWFRDQYMFASHGESGRTIKIDCLTGNHTPISEDIRTDYRGVNYCIDYDGNIFRINPDCTTIDLGLVRVNEDDHSVHMLCKKPNGKYILMDMETLEPIMANEFDNENVTCTLLDRTIDRTPILRFVSDGRNHYFIDKNYNVIKEVECDSVTVLNEYVMAISCYDEKTNKSSILKFDLTTKELTDWFEVNNNALKIGRKDNQIYVITSDKNNKVGVVDEKDNSIIPNQYDSIENTELSSIQQDKNEFTTIKESMFCAQKDGKKGLFSMDGKNILPCDYKDFMIDFSYKLLDDYRFLAQDDKGNYGIVSANGKAETDFIYKLVHRDSVRDSISRVCSKTESENNGQKNYYYGLELKNTKTGGIDYFLQGAKNIIIEAKDADVYYAGHESSEGVNSHKVPRYTQDEIFRAGVILSTVLDSGAGMHIADVIMSNETIDKTY